MQLFILKSQILTFVSTDPEINILGFADLSITIVVQFERCPESLDTTKNKHLLLISLLTFVCCIVPSKDGSTQSTSIYTVIRGVETSLSHLSAELLAFREWSLRALKIIAGQGWLIIS